MTSRLNIASGGWIQRTSISLFLTSNPPPPVFSAPSSVLHVHHGTCTPWPNCAQTVDPKWSKQCWQEDRASVTLSRYDIYGRFSRKHYKSAIFELSLLKPICCIWNVDILKIKEEKQFLLIFINVRMVGVQTKRPKSCMIVRNTWKNMKSTLLKHTLCTCS